MKNRCNNPNTWAYSYYGGRGIEVCSEWNDNPVAFYNWAIENGYDEHLTLDRIDTYGNYCPSNCRWVNRKEQGVNKRSTQWVTWNGETHTLTEWAEILNIPQKTLNWRYNNWPLERAFTEPLSKRGGWH